jgi:hypothetical protein
MWDMTVEATHAAKYEDGKPVLLCGGCVRSSNWNDVLVLADLPTYIQNAENDLRWHKGAVPAAMKHGNGFALRVRAEIRRIKTDIEYLNGLMN